jgi:CheY-like chemotaxis protein
MTSSRNSSATALVVDDLDFLRLPICKTLRSAGFRVLDASNGADALALMRDPGTPVNLLVTDYRMPGMTGVELARKCSSLNSELSILYVSASIPGDDIRTDLAKERRGFLAKPFRQAELLRRIEMLLEIESAAAPSRENRGAWTGQMSAGR